jgi:hypothetical protein
MGINQPKFSYVWNGEGYTKVPAGQQTGYSQDQINELEAFRAKQEAEERQRAQESMVLPMFPDTAPDPYTTPMPNYDIGYDQGVAPTKDPRTDDSRPDTDSRPDPDTDPRPEPVYEPMLEPQYYQPTVAPQIGYNEDLMRDPRSSPDENRQDPRSDPRMEMLRKALSGQGASSLGNSQQLASLLQMLGYSK